MEDSLIVDSSYLIDLEREVLHQSPGAAHRFLDRHRKERLYTTFTASGEVAAGCEPGQREVWERLMAPFKVLDSTPEVSWHYAQVFRYLQGVGLLIRANDLWIAATALAYEAPLVTAGLKHYARVPGLSVRSYRDG